MGVSTVSVVSFVFLGMRGDYFSSSIEWNSE